MSNIICCDEKVDLNTKTGLFECKKCGKSHLYTHQLGRAGASFEASAAKKVIDKLKADPRLTLTPGELGAAAGALFKVCDDHPILPIVPSMKKLAIRLVDIASKLEEGS